MLNAFRTAEESDIFLCLGTCSLSLGSYLLIPALGFITAGVIFIALAVIQGRA